MSSTDASDLVDSDDAGKLPVVKSKLSVTVKAKESKRPDREAMAPGSESFRLTKKRSRIALAGSDSDSTLELRETKGKGKTRSKVKSGAISSIAATAAATATTTRTRRSLRIKHKSPLRCHSSSSSSSSGSSGGGDEHANRRPRTRGALETHVRKKTRGKETVYEDASTVKNASGTIGRGSSRRKRRASPRREVRTIGIKSRASDGLKEERESRNRFGSGSSATASIARGVRSGRHLQSRNNAATGTRSPTSKRLSASAAANTSQTDSDSPYVCNDESDEEKSEREDDGLELDRLLQRRAGRRRGTAGNSNWSDRAGPRTTNVTTENGEKNIAASAGTRTALSEGDDNADGLRDTDSEGNLPNGGGAGSGGGNDNEVPALCRCGATDWKDGERWIRCDGLGCRTLEHFRCVRSGGASAGADETSDEDLPVTHLCLACKSENLSVLRTRVRAPGRLLIRGDGFSPSKRLAETSPAPAGTAPGVLEGRVAVTVRRSSRVSTLRDEARQPPRRKNVVGDEVHRDSSSSDVDAMVDGPWVGIGEDSDDDYRCDDFVAPEGQVETNQGLGCRCGAVQDRDKIGGVADADDAENASGSEATERWVQCRSDSCGVWEHATCCEHGCSERAGKHWCLACDPTGKKHVKSAEKKKTRRRREKCSCSLSEGSRGPESPSLRAEGNASRGDAAPARSGRGLDVRLSVLHGRLWRAVATGDAASVEHTFREVEGEGKERGLRSVRRLLAAGVPIERLGDGGDGGVQPVGITLLMLASGYWTVLAAAASDSSTTTGNNDTNAVTVDSCSTVAATAAAAVAGGADHPVDLSAETEKSAQQVETEAVTPTAVVREKVGNGVPTAEGVQVRDGTNASNLGSEARLAVMRTLLASSDNEAVVRAVDGAGRTAVHHASAVNGAREAALLLQGERGVVTALATDHEGMTPLHVAAAAGHSQTCISILESLDPGARAHAMAATERASGENALHLACAEGRVACVEAIFLEEKKLERELNQMGALAARVDSGAVGYASSHLKPLVLARSSNGTTPLMAAAGCPSVACVNLVLDKLLGRGFDRVGGKLEELRVADDGGMNALHWAAGRDAEGSVEVAKVMLEAERSLLTKLDSHHQSKKTSQASGGFRWDSRAMINAREAENGASPLHLAAAVSHKEMVSLLLQQGANSVMLDDQGWTPVMYANFSDRKEGAILELLQHEPEKQLEALGHVLSSRDDRHHPRVVKVVRNLVTVPAFFSLVNGFVRKNPHLLLTTLGFLRDEPGLLDFENKMGLLRTLLCTPELDLATRTALEDAARPPREGFGYNYTEKILVQRGPGEALAALLHWMKDAARWWGDSGLAAWLRIREPSFLFIGEAGYGPGVDREAWEMISEDLVRPSTASLTPHSSPYARPASLSVSDAEAEVAAAEAGNDRAASGRGGVDPTDSGGGGSDDSRVAQKAFFVAVDKGRPSYCPRDLRGLAGLAGSAEGSGRHGNCGGSSSGSGDGRRDRGDKDEKGEELRTFELLGFIIGANLVWNKVLNLNLNPVVWKTVLSRKMRLADMELVDGMYYRSLKQLLNMEGVSQLALTFGCLELDFCANGGGVDPDEIVTDINKERYAALALESRTFGRWRAQSYALSKGLRRLVPLRLLKMFTENELGLLLAGPGEVDPEDWQRHAVFSGEASASFQEWFWSVVRGLTKEERSLLLQFATGCSRLPAGGFSGLPRPFTVAILDYDPKRPLPMAATCFYMLKLPRYPEEYLLRKFLSVGIRHGSAGFEFS